VKEEHLVLFPNRLDVLLLYGILVSYGLAEILGHGRQIACADSLQDAHVSAWNCLVKSLPSETLRREVTIGTNDAFPCTSFPARVASLLEMNLLYRNMPFLNMHPLISFVLFRPSRSVEYWLGSRKLFIPTPEAKVLGCCSVFPLSKSADFIQPFHTVQLLVLRINLLWCWLRTLPAAFFSVEVT